MANAQHPSQPALASCDERDDEWLFIIDPTYTNPSLLDSYPSNTMDSLQAFQQTDFVHPEGFLICPSEGFYPEVSRMDWIFPSPSMVNASTETTGKPSNSVLELDTGDFEMFGASSLSWSPTLTTSDASSWALSPPHDYTLSLSPRVFNQPAISPGHESSLPPAATSIQPWDTCISSEAPPVCQSTISGVNVAHNSSHTGRARRISRSSTSEHTLVPHNVRVDSQELVDRLIQASHEDKLDDLRSILEEVEKYICYRETHGHDIVARATIPPPAIIKGHFGIFLGKRHIKGPDGKKVLHYMCLFCRHALSNRTQIIQHIMGKHFQYFPYECDECDATFCRPADLQKHGKDMHLGETFVCQCGKPYSNRRNHQRHQKGRCLVESA